FLQTSGAKYFADIDLVGTGSIKVHIDDWKITRSEGNRFADYTLDLIETA
ncbi:unnamed protein product, partial [marine sediment metagenome]